MSESVILQNYEVIVSIIAGILAFGVGIYTAVMLRNQIREQSKFSQRIADLEYIKLMEPKLLAMVYRQNEWPRMREKIEIRNVTAIPTAEWYKFMFLAGRIVSQQWNNERHIGELGLGGDMMEVHSLEQHVKYCNKAQYIATYEETIKHIKTEDLRNVFQTSRWAEFYELCKK